MEAEALAVDTRHFREFVLAQQPVVDEDADELLADGALYQRCGDGRVDPARQRADDPLAADACTYRRHLALDESFHRPVCLAAADSEEEVAQYLRAMRSVGHFRMELQAEAAPGGIAKRGDRRVGAVRDRSISGGHGFHAVPMTHPHPLGVTTLETCEQVAIVVDRQLG